MEERGWKLLEATPTFRKMEEKLGDLQMQALAIHVKKGYGLSHLLKKLQEKRRVIEIRLDRELLKGRSFAEYLGECLEAFSTENKELLKSAGNHSGNRIVEQHLVKRLAEMLLNAGMEQEILLVKHVEVLEEAEHIFLLREFLESLRGRMKIILYGSGFQGEENIRNIMGQSAEWVHTSDLALTREDISDMLSQMGMEKEKRETVAGNLYLYLGGWPAGTAYALNLINQEEDWVSPEYLERVHRNPVYENYFKNTVGQLPLDILKFYQRRAGGRKGKKKKGQAEEEQPWDSEYLRYLEQEQYVLRGGEEEDGCRMPRIFERLLTENPPSGEEFAGRPEEDCVYVRSFGDFQLQYRGREPVWRTKKVKELMAFFFFKQGVPVGKDAIVDALWPEYEEEKASGLFYTTMSYLKKNLEDAGIRNYIQKKQKQYWMDMRVTVSDYQLLMEMRQLLEEGRFARLEQLPSPAELYRGEFLGTLSGEWCGGMRAYLERVCLLCCRRMAEYRISEGDYVRSLSYLNFYKEIDAYSDEIWILILKCYGSLGDYKKLKQAYEEAERLYRTELQLELGAEIKAAYRQYRVRADGK